MTKKVVLSVAVLIPVLAICGVLGFSMGTQENRAEAKTVSTIQPLDLHLAADLRKLPEQEISSLF
jgi:hypothetical protein